MLKFKNRHATCIAALLASFGLPLGAKEYLDLAPSARLTVWRASVEQPIRGLAMAKGAKMLAAEWEEERDIREIRVAYPGEIVNGVRVEYWFKSWPPPPPKMPSMEDALDDPWQGKWIPAKTTENCSASECSYEFRPLDQNENPNAANLPGLRYRRTLKVRLLYPDSIPAVSSFRVFSDSEETPIRVRVQFDPETASLPAQGREYSGTFSAYNGRIEDVKQWNFEAGDKLNEDHSWTFHASGKPKGLLLDVTTAHPTLAGSNDVSIITVHARSNSGTPSSNKSFSFATADLANGPIVIPDLGIRVIELGPAAPRVSAVKSRVRERIPKEPEQTLERASREIPPLDPWNREWGGQLYLPLATDSSWQKFAVEYGGNVFISKSGTKAKGDEEKLLQWKGDRIDWKFYTGPSAYDRSDHKVSISILDGYLPVVTQKWNTDGLDYREETFSTLLRGPLSPADPSRDEHTPAVLMARFEVKNASAAGRNTDIWLSIDPHEDLAIDGQWIRGSNHVLAEVESPNGSDSRIEDLPGHSSGKAVHIRFTVPARSAAALVVKLPFVTDLSSNDFDNMKALSYQTQRERTITYWQQLVAQAVRFRVPEPKFNALAKAVIAHIHISTTKDPRTGLYIVPAASYGYDEFENESCYQVLLLDTLGQFTTAADYLETMLRLQGSKNFPGMHIGSPDAIFHGTRIDEMYDYTDQGYGLDHGTVLWTLAQHYLYSRDRQWLEHAWPHMQKAIEWIVQQRSSTKKYDVEGNKVKAYGLLPASQLEDNPDWANWFVINAYSWAGMALTAEALNDIGSPDAKLIQKEADEFLADIRSDVLRSVEDTPVVRMQDGTYEPRVPTVPVGRVRLFGPTERDYYRRYPGPPLNPLLRLGADRDTLCGPVLLLILGVFPSDSPLARWILDDWEDNLTLSSGMGMNIHGITDDRYWFSQGGMVFQANLVNPIPVYLRRHEPEASIRDLYNAFVACIYPDVNQFTEEFHQWWHGSGPFYKISDEARFANRLRDTLVLEDGDTLWLAAGTPRRWLSDPSGIEVNRTQTFFGPLSYSLRPASKPGVIEGTVRLPSNRAPRKSWLVVRAPSGHIADVKIDGEPWTNIDRKIDAIQLPRSPNVLHLEISYK